MLRGRFSRGRGDDGLALPIVGLAVVLLLVMVAFAVDLGSAAVERRNAQNGADSAALAAAQQLGLTSAKFTSGAARTSALAAATATAKKYVEDNTGLSLSSADWASCTDSFKLAVVSDTPCISYSSDATQVRVNLPAKVLAYQFGRVVGVNQTSIRGAAVAEVVSGLSGSTRPVLLAAARYGLNCIESGGVGTCPPPPLGNGDFGSLTSPRYNTVIGGSDNTNFALGLDHMLKLTPTDGVNYCDTNDNGYENKCENQVSGQWNNTPAAHDLANYLIVDSGGELKDVTEGLIGAKQPPDLPLCPAGVECFKDAGQTITALLYRPDGATPDQVRPSGSPAGPTLDLFNRSGFNGVHVSRYLLNKSAVGCGSAPDSTTVSLENSGYDACNTALGAYILSNIATPSPIFSKEILKSPRFGVAPVTDASLSGVSIIAKIVDFYGIYIDRLYGNSGKVKGIRAFVFPLSMIEPISGAGGGSLPYLGGPFGVRLIQ